MLIRIKTELSSFKTLGSVRSESLEMFFKRASQSLECNVGMQNYIRYDTTLLLLLSTLNKTLLYATLTVMLSYTLTLVLTISLLYNVNIAI